MANRYITLGLSVKDLDVGNFTDAVSSVELTTSDGTPARASRGEGYILKAKCDFSDSAVAGLCLAKVEGYVYKPFKATGARLNPEAELGDFVQIDGELYQIASIQWRLGPHITADISAPYEEAVDHEYPMLSASAKTLKMSKNYTTQMVNSAIKQTAKDITTLVESGLADLSDEIADTKSEIDEQFDDYYTKTDIDNALGITATQISQTDSTITAMITSVKEDANGEFEKIASYIRYQEIPNPFDPNYSTTPETTLVGTVIVGQLGNDNRASVRINKDGIYLDNGGTIVSLWNQNEQLSPKALTVPVGGKLTIGDILFQPRSSGNMSLMWVGQNVN